MILVKIYVICLNICSIGRTEIQSHSPIQTRDDLQIVGVEKKVEKMRI